MKQTWNKHLNIDCITLQYTYYSENPLIRPPLGQDGLSNFLIVEIVENFVGLGINPYK